jgi:chromosome segregation ATPase
MTNQQEDEVTNPNPDDTEEPKDQVTDPKPSQKPAEQDSDPDPTDWEGSYKGLQKVVAKKDEEIKGLSTKLDTLAEQLEALKNSSSLTAEEKSKLEKDLSDAKSELDNVKSERDELGKKLSRSELLMEEFSALTPLAEYIPDAEDEEGLRENAKKFADALAKYTNQEITEVLQGASETQPEGADDIDTSPSRVDELRAIINRTAGIEGKEEEFNNAYAELIELQSAEDPDKELSFS